MALFSSKTGNVKWGTAPADILDVRGWQLEQVSELKPYATSDTAGHRKRVAGHTDWTGSWTMYQDDTTQLTDNVTVGSSDTLELYEDGTLKWVGVAMIASISPNVDIESGDIVSYTVAFEANGTMAVPT